MRINVNLSRRRRGSAVDDDLIGATGARHARTVPGVPTCSRPSFSTRESPCTALLFAFPFVTSSHFRGGRLSPPSSSQELGRMRPSSSLGERRGSGGCLRTLCSPPGWVPAFILCLVSTGNKATLIIRLKEDDHQKAFAPEPTPVASQIRHASTAAPETPTEVPGVPSTAEPLDVRYNLDIHIPSADYPVPEPPVQIVRTYSLSCYLYAL